MPDTCYLAWQSAGSSNLSWNHDRGGQRSFGRSNKRARAKTNAVPCDNKIRAARSGFCGLTRLCPLVRLCRRRLRSRMNAKGEDVALRGGAGAKMKFAAK